MGDFRNSLDVALSPLKNAASHSSLNYFAGHAFFCLRFLIFLIPEAACRDLPLHPEESHAYTMWFCDAANPNDATSARWGHNRSESCNLDHHHKETVSSQDLHTPVIWHSYGKSPFQIEDYRQIIYTQANLNN